MPVRQQSRWLPLISLILGMGLPTTANYIVVSSLMAPVIVSVGAQSGLVGRLHMQRNVASTAETAEQVALRREPAEVGNPDQDFLAHDGLQFLDA